MASEVYSSKKLDRLKLENKMCWTKLEDNPIWEAAKDEYTRDPRRKYHNWCHIQQLYMHVEFTFRMKYEPALDYAILAHDVVYDNKSEKEFRSADWLDRWVTDENFEIIRDAKKHIYKTITHELTSDNRMILLDLADLGIRMKCITNRELVRKEIQLLYGISYKEFDENNLKFFRELRDNFSEDKLENLSDLEQTWFRRIVQGCEYNINQSARDLDF